MTAGVLLAFSRAVMLRPQIVHLHDPELLPIAILLKYLGIVVIYDMHELLSSQLETKFYLKKFISKYFLREFLKFIEFLAVKNSQALVLAEDGYLGPMSKANPKFQKKFYVIRNYPHANKIISLKKEAVKNYNGIILVYIGGLMEIRGIKELILAVSGIENAKLILVGPWASQKFKEDCMNLKEYKCVEYRGVLSFEETIKIVKTADIGLSTLYPDKNYLTSLPTKFYEYALCKIPILMSNFPYWEKTFNGMAWFTDPKDPEEIKLSISRIINCPSSRDKVQKAFKKVLSEWNWENEQVKLISLYSKLSST
jgi:glycosyltransferase involved in cell wall biosynthesis